MASFALVVLQPPGYPHIRAFDEIILLLYHSLSELGHNVSVATNSFPAGATPIVFGAHLVGAEFDVEISAKSIIFNTEQLSSGNLSWAERISSFSKNHTIWDYSSANLCYLRETASAINVHRLRLGYHPELERVPTVRSDDEGFLFFGSVTPHREAILSKICVSDRLRLKALFGLYGWERNKLLARCRAVVNIHSHPVRILEWPRILQLVANGVPCICLLHSCTKAEDEQLSYVLSCDEADPMPGLESWFASSQALRQHAALCRERFRANEHQAHFTEQLLDHSFGAGFIPLINPPKILSWSVADSQQDPDPLWYQNVYPWTYDDPRGTAEFHRQEGVFRQYHPNPEFAACFRRPIAFDQYSLPITLDVRVAVVLHFHSEAKARLFFALYGVHLGKYADFYVTTTSEVLSMAVQSLGLDYGVRGLSVVTIENRGRDIPSKYIVFNDALLGYDLCLFSHGKESDRGWFHASNRALAGSCSRIQRILSYFVNNPDLGLLFPDYLPYLRPSIGWGTMRPMIDNLLGLYGCDTSPIKLLEFPAGGFFWARPHALWILHSLDLQPAFLPGEPLANDNTLLHAIERMVCLSCEMMGYKWEKLSD